MAKRLKLTTPQDVRKALNKIANLLLNGEISSQAANAIIYASNVVLSSIRADEQEKRIETIEKVLSQNNK